MSGIFFWAGALLALGVVVVLARGIWSFGAGDGSASAARFSNRMMRWRVGLQFLALVLFMLAYALFGRG